MLVRSMIKHAQISARIEQHLQQQPCLAASRSFFIAISTSVMNLFLRSGVGCCSDCTIPPRSRTPMEPPFNEAAPTTTATAQNPTADQKTAYLRSIDALERHVRCPICLGTLDDPHHISACKHSFCRDCCAAAAPGAEACPLCRAPATRLACIPTHTWPTSRRRPSRRATGCVPESRSCLMGPCRKRGAGARAPPVADVQPYVAKQAQPMQLSQIFAIRDQVSRMSTELSRVNSNLADRVAAAAAGLPPPHAAAAASRRSRSRRSSSRRSGNSPLHHRQRCRRRRRRRRHPLQLPRPRLRPHHSEPPCAIGRARTPTAPPAGASGKRRRPRAEAAGGGVPREPPQHAVRVGGASALLARAWQQQHARRCNNASRGPSGCGGGGSRGGGGAPSVPRRSTRGEKRKAQDEPDQPVAESVEGSGGVRGRGRRGTSAAAAAASASPIVEVAASTAADDEAAADEDEQGGDDERCCVCGSEEDDDNDRIVFCDGCNIAVHQSCYGIPVVPEGDLEWFCEPCTAKRAGGKRAKAASELTCPACPLTSGAFKATLDGKYGGWAHAACTFLIKGPGFNEIVPTSNPHVNELIGAAGFERAWEARPELGPHAKRVIGCALCEGADEKRSGLRVQCAYKKCTVAFHVSCALENGQLADGEMLYCANHSKVERKKLEDPAIRLRRRMARQRRRRRRRRRRSPPPAAQRYQATRRRQEDAQGEAEELIGSLYNRFV